MAVFLLYSPIIKRRTQT